MKDTVNLVKKIFENHYEFHSKIESDTLKSASGHTSQVSSDYQGRVLYELLQNAFDRAERKIIVKVIGNSLLVANDGKKFTYTDKHDYKNGGIDGEEFKRSDFNSLCSISTSNKTASESIGNKGVGFKSVYALARYANIHTKGSVYTPTYLLDENISFRVYDVFDDTSTIPKGFTGIEKDHLVRMIKSIQREFPKRGVPGYYFPLQIESNNIFNNFEEGIVTIIEVPFITEEEVNNLIDEIEDIHFEFVGLKYNNDFEISFERRDQCFTKKIFSNDNTLFSANLNKDEIQKLAQIAQIEIKEPKVAIKFKKEPKGLFYNYLPTQKESPFRYVDFHADFHTTVDRKSINFDGEKVGAYNRALLESCLELYFLVLRSYTENSEKISIKAKYLENFDLVLNDFNWNFIDAITPVSDQVYLKIYNLFQIDHRINRNTLGNNLHFINLVKLLASISKKYFDLTDGHATHNIFFNNTLSFISSFTNDFNTKYSRQEEFKRELFGELKRRNARVIPEIDFEETNEIVFRKRGESNINLPNSIQIAFTDFEIQDQIVKSILGVKDFTDSNEVLKHFKQCSYSGEIHDAVISEEEQKEILKSCFDLYQGKREENTLSSHRYTNMFSSTLRRTHNTSNLADFNVATLFLKLQDGKYKPAQLCIKSDLDHSFFEDIPENELDNWLRYLGVSLESDYIFADRRIYEKFKNGLLYIPNLQARNESTGQLFGKDALKNLQVISRKGRQTHPAIINDNNYSFLDNIQKHEIRNELKNLKTKDYNNFPEEYLEILFDAVRQTPSGVERLYPSIFHQFHKVLNKYLIVESGILKWSSFKDTFFVAKNRNDFDLLKKQQISLLVYFQGLQVPEEIKSRTISLEEGEINYLSQCDISEEFIKLIESKMIFLINSVSSGKLSELNFKESPSKIKELQSLVHDTKVFEVSQLSQEIKCKGIDLCFQNHTEGLFNKNEIYFVKGCSTRTMAEVLAKYLFKNSSIVSEVELILFFKEFEDLEKEADADEIEYLKKSWYPDYHHKFLEFQQKILDHYRDKSVIDFPKWFIHSETNKSDFLIEVYNSGKISDLRKAIQSIKKLYLGQFDDFDISIDFSLNDERISEAISILKAISDKNLAIDPEALISELKEISQKLGEESRLLEIESLLSQFKKTDKGMNSDEQKKNTALGLKVDRIYNQFSFSALKESKFEAAGIPTSIELKSTKIKIVFQGNSYSPESVESLEIIGSNGEEQVLKYCIDNFLKLPIEIRELGINEVYEVIKCKLNNDSHKKFKESCLKVVDQDAELRRELIPLFYIALHHKYSYFDLICYKDGKPTLIEVKTTKSFSKNSFIISIAEVEAAIKEPFYEIVRVTPTEMIFMGNPIKGLNETLDSISGDNYSIRSQSFKFEFKR